MVYRIYVEKRRTWPRRLRICSMRPESSCKSGPDWGPDHQPTMENIEKDLFDYAVKTVFSEPQLDTVSETIQAQGRSLPWSTSPDSLTSEPTPPPSASRSLSQGSGPPFVPLSVRAGR